MDPPMSRQDQVDETWRIMLPLLDAPPGVHSYELGPSGPEAAGVLVAEHGGWRDRWVTL
jgi:glucose-6-phosphate 1-dehydrogenase